MRVRGAGSSRFRAPGRVQKSADDPPEDNPAADCTAAEDSAADGTASGGGLHGSRRPDGTTAATGATEADGTIWEL